MLISSTRVFTSTIALAINDFLAPLVVTTLPLAMAALPLVTIGMSLVRTTFPLVML